MTEYTEIDQIERWIDGLTILSDESEWDKESLAQDREFFTDLGWIPEWLPESVDDVCDDDFRLVLNEILNHGGLGDGSLADGASDRFCAYVARFIASNTEIDHDEVDLFF